MIWLLSIYKYAGGKKTRRKYTETSAVDCGLMGDIQGLAMYQQPAYLQVLRWRSYGLVPAGPGRKGWHCQDPVPPGIREKESEKGHPATLPGSDVTMAMVGLGWDLETERNLF